MTAAIWSLAHLRALPPESMPTGAAVQFVGGMLDGKVKHLPTTPVDDAGPLPFYGATTPLVRPGRQELTGPVRGHLCP